MYTIDDILDMLDWNNSPEVQNKGIELAKQIKCINVFLQPLHRGYNKNIWDNCAIILSQRSDEELRPYANQLLEWVQDLNWPGALTIFERMKNYKDKESIDHSINHCIKIAKAFNYSWWIECLEEIRNT